MLLYVIITIENCVQLHIKKKTKKHCFQYIGVYITESPNLSSVGWGNNYKKSGMNTPDITHLSVWLSSSWSQKGNNLCLWALHLYSRQQEGEERKEKEKRYVQLCLPSFKSFPVSVTNDLYFEMTDLSMSLFSKRSGRV